MTKEKGADGAKAEGTVSSDPPSPTQFEQFEQFARRIVSVPKSEIDEQERLYQEGRRKRKEPLT